MRIYMNEKKQHNILETGQEIGKESWKGNLNRKLKEINLHVD